MKKTLISLLLFSSTTVFANNANLVDDASCANIVRQVYETSIKREGDFLNSASQAINQIGTELASNFGQTASCLNTVKDQVLSINVGVPGMEQIMKQVVNQVDTMLGDACKSAVAQVNSSLQKNVNKYSNIELFRSDYFSGIRVNSSIR